MRNTFRNSMNTWFYKSLGDAISAAQPADQIRDAFPALFESAGKPSHMAIFTRTESEGRLHCEVSVYFSPAAADLAAIFDAKPSPPPLRGGLELLAGDQACWSALFPKSGEPKLQELA